MTLDLSSVIPVRDLAGDVTLWNHDLEEMFQEASSYLKSFSWVSNIAEAYFGLGIEGVVAVFLFRIEPGSRDVDPWLWVVVGDLPPAYLVTDEAQNPARALKAYIEEMTEWVKAAKSGQSVDHLIPVNVPPTVANAVELERRLRQLDDDVLSEYSDDSDDEA